MASPGLKRGSIQHFMASFEDFLRACRRDEVVGERSCVVPAAFLLLFRSVCLPRFTLHYILHCPVTLRVYRRGELEGKKNASSDVITSSLCCHVTRTWSRDMHSTMEESCFQQKFSSEEDDHLILNTHF